MNPDQAATDARYMAMALRLAERGILAGHPNPRVGCVVVRDGTIVGQGWHEKAGEPHAEAVALARAGERARGATVYVTLEPCCHFGKTPPCTRVLIEAGVERVVAAMEDPDPRVAGQGFATLRAAGIETVSAVLQSCAEELNRGFCKRLRAGIPYVTSKLAISLDGRTAMADGESRWITGQAARDDVQRLRAGCSAIMTGIQTVIDDDPSLNLRLPEYVNDAASQPLRIVLDSSLRLDPGARIGQVAGRVLVLAGNADSAREKVLQDAGFEVVRLGCTAGGRLDLAEVMTYLGRIGVNELMVEAGAVLNGALIEAGCVDEWVVYQAPCVLGSNARGMVETAAIHELCQRKRLRLLDARQIGADLRLRYRVEG